MRLRSIRSNRWLALPVTALLLALVGAPVLSRMDCLMSGHSTFAIGNMEDCCPHDGDADEPTLRAVCCELAQTAPEKADYLRHSIATIDLQVVAADAPLLTLTPESSAPARHALASRPPPLSAPLRLSRLGLLLL